MEAGRTHLGLEMRVSRRCIGSQSDRCLVADRRRVIKNQQLSAVPDVNAAKTERQRGERDAWPSF